MKKELKISAEDMKKYKLVAFRGETPLEVAELLRESNQVAYKLRDSDEFLVASPLPKSKNYLVRYMNHGQIFKNTGEASLCFIDLVHECLYTDSLNFDIHDN